MNEICYKVNNYYIEFLGTASSSEDQDLMAKVILFSEEVDGVAAELKFYAPQRLWMKRDDLSDPSSPTPVILGHMSKSEIGPVMDTLRNEEPIYILWLKESGQVSLRTYLEPVGEEEG